MAIKPVLKEELENSFKIQKKYEEELDKLPKGSIIKKKIKNKHETSLQKNTMKTIIYKKGKEVCKVKHEAKKGAYN